MTELAWLTDIHLNCVHKSTIEEFFDSLARLSADAFLITGDIAEAPDVAAHLADLAAQLGRPIYFVLGNHDFYRSGLARVRANIDALCVANAHLHWMNRENVVRLTDKTCLIGNDGWGDGRLGDC